MKWWVFPDHLLLYECNNAWQIKQFKFVVHLNIFSQFNSQSGRPPASIESFPVSFSLIGREKIGQVLLLANVTVTILCDDSWDDFRKNKI